MRTNSKRPRLVAACVLALIGIGLLQAAPVPEKKEPKWKQEFDKLYSLKDGEVVKVVPRADQPDCRLDTIREWLQTGSAFKPKPEQLEDAARAWHRDWAFVFTADAAGKCRVHFPTQATTFKVRNGVQFNPGVAVHNYLPDWRRHEITIERAAEDVSFVDYSDLVVRDRTPRADVVSAFDKALHGQLNAKFRIEVRDMEQEVWVASGKVDFKPRAWRKAGELDVYSDEANVNKEAKYDSIKAGDPRYDFFTLKNLLSVLSDRFETWVVWADGKPPEVRLLWAEYWRNTSDVRELRADRDPDKVLANVAEQTGLTFKKEKRKVPMLVIRERK